MVQDGGDCQGPMEKDAVRLNQFGTFMQRYTMVPTQDSGRGDMAKNSDIAHGPEEARVPANTKIGSRTGPFREDGMLCVGHLYSKSG